MRTLRLKSRLLRATSAGLSWRWSSAPAAAQLRPGAADRAKELNQQADAQQCRRRRRRQSGGAAGGAGRRRAQRIIQHIVVRGTQRVEAGTVLTYIGLREGDTYDPADVDRR